MPNDQADTDAVWDFAIRRASEKGLDLETQLRHLFPNLTEEGVAAFATSSWLMQAVTTAVSFYFPNMDITDQSMIGHELKNKLAAVMKEELDRIQRETN